ncbi:unnamed protein product [Closterium sp. NIES-54]
MTVRAAHTPQQLSQRAGGPGGAAVLVRSSGRILRGADQMESFLRDAERLEAARAATGGAEQMENFLRNAERLEAGGGAAGGGGAGGGGEGGPAMAGGGLSSPIPPMHHQLQFAAAEGALGAGDAGRGDFSSFLRNAERLEAVHAGRYAEMRSMSDMGGGMGGLQGELAGGMRSASMGPMGPVIRTHIPPFDPHTPPPPHMTLRGPIPPGFEDGPPFSEPRFGARPPHMQQQLGDPMEPLTDVAPVTVRMVGTHRVMVVADSPVRHSMEQPRLMGHLPPNMPLDLHGGRPPFFGHQQQQLQHFGESVQIRGIHEQRFPGLPHHMMQGPPDSLPPRGDFFRPQGPRGEFFPSPQGGPHGPPPHGPPFGPPPFPNDQGPRGPFRGFPPMDPRGGMEDHPRFGGRGPFDGAGGPNIGGWIDE